MEFRRCQVVMATALLLAGLAGAPARGQSAPASGVAPAPAPEEQKTLGLSRAAAEDRKIGREKPSAWMPWVQTLAALALVAGLIFLAGRLLRRAGRTGSGAGGEVVEILARKGVGPKQQVLLMRVGRRLLVVGSSATGLNTLSEITDEREMAALAASIEAARGESFLSILHRRQQQAKAGSGTPGNRPPGAEGGTRDE